MKKQKKEPEEILAILNSKNAIYFAHPMSTYGSSEEKAILKFLEQKTTAQIFNPALFPAKDMTFYFQRVKESDVLIFSSNPDGSIGKGVYSELKLAAQLKKPIFYIDPLSLYLTRDFVVLKFIEDEEKADWENYAHVNYLRN
ncbi:MAG: hypothetical protein ACFFDI_01880 [Promethearchaeota archaeon]